MTHIYLRLDLYIKKNNQFKLTDRINLESKENVFDLLQGFSDCTYAKLLFIIEYDNKLHSNISACFKKIKNKNKYNWILCQSKEV